MDGPPEMRILSRVTGWMNGDATEYAPRKMNGALTMKIFETVSG